MEHRLSRRAALAAAAWVGTSLLSSCGGRPQAGGPVVLALQAPYDAALLGRMIPQFQAAHPGIRVNVGISPAPGSPGLAAALLTGSGPDVFWDIDPSRYLGGPLLVDLLPLARASGFALTDFGSAILAAYRFGSGLFMLPRTVSPSAYAARTDLWNAAGLSLPQAPYTAAELASQWARLSVGARVIGGQLAWSPSATFYLNGWGAHLVDPQDATQCALGSAAAAACGQWMYQRFWADNSAQGLQGQFPSASFVQGTLAMQVVSCAGLPAFAAGAEAVPWTLVPFPDWPQGPSTAAQTDFYAISAASPHIEAAWLLLSFISSPSWQQAAIASRLLPPSRQSLWNQYIQAIPATLPLRRGLPLGVYAQPVQQDWARPPEQFRYQAPAARLLSTYWQSMFGPGPTLSVHGGFPQAAAAVDAAEQAAAATTPT